MNTTVETTKKIDTKVLLSTLWIVVMITTVEVVCLLLIIWFAWKWCV